MWWAEAGWWEEVSCLPAIPSPPPCQRPPSGNKLKGRSQGSWQAWAPPSYMGGTCKHGRRGWPPWHSTHSTGQGRHHSMDALGSIPQLSAACLTSAAIYSLAQKAPTGHPSRGPNTLPKPEADQLSLFINNSKKQRVCTHQVAVKNKQSRSFCSASCLYSSSVVMDCIYGF